VASWLQRQQLELELLPVLEPQPQPMLAPKQVLTDPIGQPQFGLELRLVPGLMPLLELMLQLGLVLEPKLELMPQLVLALVLVLELMLKQLLGPELIHRLEPKLAPINQLVALQLEQQQQLMDQQLEQHQAMESLIIEPELLLVHLELQPAMAPHHLKAFDWSKQVVLGSNPECMPRHRDTISH